MTEEPESTFEEAFPSITAYDAYVRPMYSDVDDAGVNRVVTITDVRRHCLDKQRVIDVLEEIMEQARNGDAGNATEIITYIKQELRL